MRSAPLVTVALPVYNSVATLPETLDSVRRQTLADWELVVVCNGCSDGSEAVARAAAGQDSRIRVETLERANVVAAANRATELARAPLLARIDADDVMPPRRLEMQRAAMDAHAEWSACTGQVVHDGDKHGGMQRHVDWLNSLRTPDDIANQRFVESPVANPSAMIRTEVLRSFGGFGWGDYAEDYDMWLRLLGAGHRVGRVDAQVLVWRDLPSRLTRTDGRYGVDAMRWLKHRHLMQGPLKNGARTCRIWGSGPYGKRHAKGLVAMGARVDAFIDIDPRKIGGAAAGGIPVMGPEALGCADERLMLVAVATLGARQQVMKRLDEAGYRQGRDYLPVQ